MPASEARISANRQNCLKSTGPKTVEGKERSRRNGLKHGLTGEGIVVPEEDSREIERRNEELQGELDPQSGLGKILVRELATLSVRMERGARQEEVALSSRVRHAADVFDETRLDDAERLFVGIVDDPRGQLRKLRKSPEGVDRLIVAWQELRNDLIRAPRPLWTDSHRERVENLIGFRIDSDPVGRIKALTEATRGYFGHLSEQDGGELDIEARKGWARARLIERIDAEIAGLEAHYETLDFVTIDLDRAEAGDRALFDPSREASLARRYESEARRGFFKSLKEFRQAEAEIAARPLAPEPAPPQAPLASSWVGESSSSSKSVDAPWPTVPTGNGVARGPDGRVLAVGRTVPMPG
jgi:hypothetical protein